MPTIDAIALSSALSQKPGASAATSLVETIAAASGSSDARPRAEISSFPGESFYNYYALGVSFAYILPASATQASSSDLLLDRIDIYNPDTSASTPTAPTRPGRRPKPTFARFPLDLTFTFPTTTITLPPPPPSAKGSQDTKTSAPTTRERDKTFVVRAQTCGRDFVAALGEPTRKGGGGGRVSGFAGIPPFMEWKNVELESSGTHSDEGRQTALIDIMVDLRDPGAAEVLTEEQRKNGAGGVWDRAANWQWSCLKILSAG